MQFQVYADPGHSWVKVSKKLLEKLGIANKITKFSYQRGDFAYIEEDCDASTFVKALRENNIEYSFKVNNSNKRSRIRNYQRYFYSETVKDNCIIQF